jgi:hypothetical protein
MSNKKDPFDIKLTNNMPAKGKYYKDKFYSSSPGTMIKKPTHKMGGGKISKYYSAGGTVITGRD